MSGPSEKATEAARANSTQPKRTVVRLLSAAHDPRLGLDRSVCLRDVLAAIEAAYAPVDPPVEIRRVLDELRAP